MNHQRHELWQVVRDNRKITANDRNNRVSHEGIWRQRVVCVIAPAIAGGLLSASDDIAK